ncbi:hypothetical protein A4E84_04295 [Streptomyces qaidamensis]|uniref:Condensation domain-containing protein n=1 Tax=Streptomyces qaidamensis TaxID=1783515 RepID=A0A143BVB6_9ACTN|nr:hypothetical protein A4E84_04295 [Streptomyces qaidamensis]
MESADRANAAPPVGVADRTQPLPLSFAQQRLWFLDQLDPGPPEYNVLCPSGCAEKPLVGALAAALGAVVARHEVLRTRWSPVRTASRTR